MIDLHAHSIVSDGTFTPEGVIQLAKELGLSAIALTDHDNIQGLDAAQKEADRLEIRLIKGIEFDAVYDKGRRLHILGLNIDPTNTAFITAYEAYRAGKAATLDHVFKGLATMGVDVTPDMIEPYRVGPYMDRQAIAKFLVARGYAAIMKKAWVDYLDKIEFMPGELISAKDSIDMIHSAGGKAFLAHYHIPIGLKGYSDEEAIDCLRVLKEFGLDGMEYYYPSFTNAEQERCGEYIEMFDFLKSGGSDFHGLNRAHIQLGIGEGDFSVPDEVLEALL